MRLSAPVYLLCPAGYGAIMRPNVSDEVVEDVNRVVGELVEVDPESVRFEERLKVWLKHVGKVPVEGDRPMEDPNEPYKVREKYRK